MINSKILFENLVKDLALPDSNEEIKAIAFALLNHFGISKTDVLSKRNTNLDYAALKPFIKRLNKNEPLQYILNEAWFCGHKFFVNPAVLIPRPETELLVEEVAKFILTRKEISILDVGTGSGCIAIALALQFPTASILALDVSHEALDVAKKNADNLGAKIHFIVQNILDESPVDLKFDLIVSNPPYVSAEEKGTLPKNVVEFEPHLALFAHENDPLIFYRAIANVSTQLLNRGGRLMVEINERFGSQVESIFINQGLIDCKIRKDLAGKNRILSVAIG